MAYIDWDYYQAHGTGKIEQPDFALICEVASDVLDAYTMHALKRYPEVLTDGDVKQRMERATLYQCEHIASAGGIEAYQSDNTPLASKSETIGNYSNSQSFATDKNHQKRVNGLVVSPLAAYLIPDVVAIGRSVAVRVMHG